MASETAPATTPKTVVTIKAASNMKVQIVEVVPPDMQSIADLSRELLDLINAERRAEGRE